MKINITTLPLVLSLLFPSLVQSQNQENFKDVISIQSAVLGEKRQIYVGLPPGYNEDSRNYPVLYITDAEYRFDLCRSVQTYFVLTTRIPHSIIIGIPNISRETRNRDLLPENWGGKDSQFTEFIKQELIPRIESDYRCDTTRIISGHSHGGVYTINTLLKSGDLFEKYIATDPSFNIVTEKADSLLAQSNLTGKSLYLTSSDGAYGYNKEISSDMKTSNAIFKHKLIKNENNGLRYIVEHITDDHGNSFITAFHRGLRFVFDWPISDRDL